jgi:hypothetical protein
LLHDTSVAPLPDLTVNDTPGRMVVHGEFFKGLNDFTILHMAARARPVDTNLAVAVLG